MDGSWRFRPLQSPLCPVCSTSHYPFCPPPPSSDRLALAAVDRHRRFPPPFQDAPFSDHRPPPPFPLPPHQDPFLDHRAPPPFAPPIHHPHHHPRVFAEDEFLQPDPFRKRMRVEDPNPFSPPPPRFFWDDERRLSLIREHGRQDLAPIQDHGFNNGYLGFQDLPRPQSSERVLPSEWRDFGGGEVGSVRTSRQGSDFCDLRPQSVHQDHPVQLNASSSYSLPKQPQYPHVESYQRMQRITCNEQESPHPLPSYTQPESYRPRIANNEHENPYPSSYHNMQRPLESKLDIPFEPKQPYFEEMRRPLEAHENIAPYEYRMDSAVSGRVHTSQMYPPLPPQPPLPPPPEPSPPPSSQVGPSVLAPPPKLSPEPVSAPPTLFPIATNSQRSLERKPMVQSKFYNEIPGHGSTGFVSEGLPIIHQRPSKEYMEGRKQSFLVRNTVKDKPTTVNACHLFRQPHRASRPDHIVVILRGLPGSGKSYLAKALRDLEVEAGGNAPRIHAMDDYFMIEVEKKVEDNESSKSSGSSRGRKQITKKVIEYCYEPEMEEAYRSSMLKAFKKTLDEGNFTFIIVDDRNLRVADFAQFWAIAKRSGYEVYLLEATYKDPTGCAARNVHGFTLEDIQKMAERWEEAPSLYLQLDIQSLFHGDHLSEQSIQEVEMDTDDGVDDEEESDKLQQREYPKIAEPKTLENTLGTGFVKVGERWHDDDEEEEEEEEEEKVIGIKDLENSKWSKDLEEDTENAGTVGGNLSALSGLIQAYGKGEKSVHWGDQVEKGGFSIGVVKKQNKSSLIIGPGSGYNLSSNPTQEDDAFAGNGESNVNESKRRFTEQLRAERESFKAVFDKRRQRIGGRWDVVDD